jgi:hypothetical protein
MGLDVSVNLAPMGDDSDINRFSSIINYIDNAIVAHAHPPEISAPGELRAPAVRWF